MKTCFKCGIEKPKSEFYAHKRMADGLLGKCKDCTRSDSEARRAIKETDPRWMAKELDRHALKSRRMRLNGSAYKPTKEEKQAYQIKHRTKYPDKYKAKCAVNNAIRDGRLKPHPCHCGAKAQAHHDDYSRPLDVVWLCASHHAERHVEMRRAALLNK